MADAVDTPWPTENIPDQDLLYMRVHRNNTRDGAPTAGAFKRHGEGLSTDWAKYCAGPEDTRGRAKSSQPQDHAIVSFVVGNVRADPRFTVMHTPIQRTIEDPIGNRAHADIRATADVSKTEFRAKLSDLCKVEILLDAPLSLTTDH